jgi:hypothetical protein
MPSKPVRVYLDHCPLCVGRVGYAAFDRRHASALTHGSKFALQLGSNRYALSIFMSDVTHRDSNVVCIETKRQGEDKPGLRAARSLEL